MIAEEDIDRVKLWTFNEETGIWDFTSDFKVWMIKCYNNI